MRNNSQKCSSTIHFQTDLNLEGQPLNDRYMLLLVLAQNAGGCIRHPFEKLRGVLKQILISCVYADISLSPQVK